MIKLHDKYFKAFISEKEIDDVTQDLTNRTVVILEDIIDTGRTLDEVHRIFKNEDVKQLYIATLFYKPEAYNKDFKLHYIGIEIPNKFIVGYGLDYDGLGRDLPAVYQLKKKNII